MVKWIESEFGDSSDWENEKDWKPEGAGELVGTLVGKRTVDTKYGPTVVLKIESDGEVFNVWGSRAGLKTLIEQYDDMLTVGTELGLRCQEKITLKSGNTFVPYQIGFGDGVPVAASQAPDDEPF